MANLQGPQRNRPTPGWTTRVRVGVALWAVTLVMAVPVAIATVFILLILLQATWNSPNPGGTVLMVGTCGAMLGAAAGLVARMTRGWVLQTSGDTLRAEPAMAACAVAVAALLIVVDLRLLSERAAQFALPSLPPIAAAAAAHLRWPDSPLTAGSVAAAAATIATLFLGF